MKSLLALNKTNSQQDPNTIAKKRIDALIVKNSEIDLQLAKAGIFFLNHEQRVTIEKNLLQKKGDLELQSIKQLPRILLPKEKNSGKKTNKTDKTTPKFYQQQLKIQFLGSYPESLRYLHKIEETNLQLHWEMLNYKTINHPTGLLTIVVSNISLQ
ncbi:MAG: hypothetical protein HQL68_12850 [Magnetococcales bacterium]|nr:hypothetical protein [Magnetococcales bacterium]